MTDNAPEPSPATALPDRSVAVILPAAGKSRRFGGEEKKIFAPLGGRPVWQHAAETLRRRREVGPIAIAVDPDDRGRWENQYADSVSRLEILLVDGGAERSDSVLAGLDRVGAAAWVAVHDAARPLVADAELAAVFTAARDHGAALLARPAHGTLKRDDGHRRVRHTVDRRGIWEALTPQVFRTSVLREAYARWRGRPATDDAELVERCGHPVHLVPGSPMNLKLTTADDLLLAEAILAARRSGLLAEPASA